MQKTTIFNLLLCLFLLLAWLAVSLNFTAKIILPANQYQQFFNQKVIMQAYIVSDPLPSNKQTISFEIKPIAKYSQKILVTTYSRDNYFYGDRLYIVGKIKQPLASVDFNYEKYLQAQGIYAQMSSPQAFIVSHNKLNYFIFYSLKFKHFVYDRFFANLSKEKAALLVALIVGQKNLLSEDTVTAFNLSGTAHLIAVSGYILTLLLAFSVRLRKYLGLHLMLVIFVAVGGIFIVMAGFAAGVLRAAVMAALILIAKLTGRQYATMPTLLLTAALLVAANPLIIKYDIGFMLSFSSIAGIILFVPLLEQLLKFLPSTFGIRTIVAMTLAAQAATLPITLFYFHQFSLIAPLTNLLVVPVVELCLLLGYFLCLPILGIFAAKIITVPLNYMLIIVYSFANFKYATLSLDIGWQVFLALYALLGVVYFVLRAKLKDQLFFDKMFW